MISRSSGQDGKILIWDIKEGNIFSEVNLDDGWIEHLSWSPNGELLAASCSRNAYILINMVCRNGNQKVTVAP